MTTNIPSQSLSASTPVASSTPPTASNEQNEQALLDLGLLAYLANGYNNASSPAAKAAILAQFEALQGQFQMSGGTLTFTYTDDSGQTEQVQITDPTVLGIVQGMFNSQGQPLSISAYNTLWTGDSSPALSIATWLQSNTDLETNTNAATQAAALAFFLTFSNGQIGQLSGVTQAFLSNSFAYAESEIGAEALAVFLQGNPALAAAIGDCAAAGPQTGAAGQFATQFALSEQNVSADPLLTDAFSYQGRYWRDYFAVVAKPLTVNAAPVAPFNSIITNEEKN